MVDDILPFLPDHEVTEDELDQAHGFELNVPREVGSELVKRMVEFWNESETAYREHASTLDNAHRTLAHPTDLRFGHIQRIAQRLVGGKSPTSNGALSEPTIYAVHKALCRSGFAFSFDKRSHGSTGIFLIRPIHQVEMVERVQSSLRAYQEDTTRMANGASNRDSDPDSQNVSDFVGKAKRLIRLSRRTREATASGNVGPSSVRLPIAKGSDSTRFRWEDQIHFTETEQSIIRFMEAWACSRLFFRHPRLCALGPVVLRATGEYDDYELNPATGFMFLQEIGILLPFENRVKYDENLLLPTSQHSQVLERLQSRTGQESSEMQDSMQDLRKRWTDTVFCIDSSSTLEVDDGISVERVLSSPDEHWIHVHIANPTAFFSRDNVLGKIAGHMTETVYMPERNYLMLPSRFSVNKFSLANQRCAITFSARINMTGEILEKKITPSILDRVIRLTPQDCRNALGPTKARQPELSVTVGGKIPSRPTKGPIHLKDHEIKDLRLLVSLTQARKKSRAEAGASSFHLGYPDVKVYNRLGMEGLGHAPPSRAAPRFVDGDPIIHMQTNPYQSNAYLDDGNQVKNLVEESMLLACETGAGWCKERKIPVVYRGIGRRSESADPQAFYDTTLRPLIDAGTRVPLHLAFEYGRLFGQVVFDTNPVSHRSLALPFFTRVTSPLRRYGDLIAHWQIEAALRKEAATGMSLAGTSEKDDEQSPGYLPFSRSDIDLIIQRLQPRERLIRKAKGHANSFWFSMLVWRAWKYDEAEIPTTFEVLVYRSAGSGFKFSSVIIKEWGMTAGMILTRTTNSIVAEEARDGDWWEARLHSVDVYRREVMLEPIRLLSRDF